MSFVHSLPVLVGMRQYGWEVLILKLRTALATHNDAMSERDFSVLPRLAPRETLLWASRVSSVSADADSSPAVPAVLAFAAALTTPVGEGVLAAFL